MLHIHRYSTCGISKELVLKYDTNSYANIGTICKYFGNTFSRNILRYHANTDCDTTSFFNRTGKVNPFKELLKNSNCLSLIECFSKNKSLGKRYTEKCMTFTETVLYGRNINEAYVEASINIYDSQKTKSSMALPPYPGCVTRTIVRAHYQCYYLVHCLQQIVSPILSQDYGWFFDCESDFIRLVWFKGDQVLSLLTTKSESQKERKLMITRVM